MKVRWLSSALVDLRGIRDYLVDHNPTAAQQVIACIRLKVSMLATQTNIGRLGRLPDTKKLVIQPYPYIVAYRVHPNEVQILAVVHTSRRWPEAM